MQTEPIQYKVGDLLAGAVAGEVDAIAHCCNCYCTMGSGIAPKIKAKWPDVYAADYDTKSGDCSKLGTFTKAVVEDGDLTVYNLYGQFGYSKRNQGIRDLNYNALYDALDRMGDDVVVNGGRSVGLPLIGCGLAGGNWKIVEVMIQETLVAKGLQVVIYQLK